MRWHGLSEVHKNSSARSVCGARAGSAGEGARTHARSTAPITTPAWIDVRPSGALAVATALVYPRLVRPLTPSPPGCPDRADAPSSAWPETSAEAFAAQGAIGA